MDLPFDVHARCVHHAPHGLTELRSDPVSRNQSNRMSHHNTSRISAAAVYARKQRPSWAVSCRRSVMTALPCRGELAWCPWERMATMHLVDANRVKVLVVEDDEMVRSYLGRVLESADFEVIEASTGAESMDLMGRDGSNFAVAVIDGLLPDMHGSDLA